MKILVLICLYGLAAPSQAQFFPSFYSTPNFPSFQPIFSPFQYSQPQFYYQPFPQQPFYQFPAQVNQQVTPQPTISQKSNTEQPSVQTPKLSQPVPVISQGPFPGVFQSQAPSALNDLLGYSYRTDFGDGATSAVVFFQGGSPDGISLAKARITVASDSVDPQKTKDIEVNIQKALSERTGKALAHSPVLDFSPVVSAILKNPSAQTGTFFYYQSDDLPADTTLLKPPEDTSSTTIASDTDETTTVKNDETTMEDIYTLNIDDDEDVGQETEPSVSEKAEEEPAESIVNESVLKDNKSKTEKQSLPKENSSVTSTESQSTSSEPNTASSTESTTVSTK